MWAQPLVITEVVTDLFAAGAGWRLLRLYASRPGAKDFCKRRVVLPKGSMLVRPHDRSNPPRAGTPAGRRVYANLAPGMRIQDFPDWRRRAGQRSLRSVYFRLDDLTPSRWRSCESGKRGNRGVGGRQANAPWWIPDHRGKWKRGSTTMRVTTESMLFGVREDPGGIGRSRAVRMTDRLANPTLGSGLHSKTTPLSWRRLPEASRLRR